MKKFCKNCNKALGLFNAKYNLQDAIICSQCYKLILSNGMGDCTNNLKNFPYKKFKTILDSKCEMCKKFNIEDNLGELLKIDYNNRMIVFNEIILNFNELKSYEIKFYYETTTTTITSSNTKKGVGKALAGGLLFGFTGAIVGGLTAKSKTKSNSQSSNSTVCSNVKVFLSLKNYYDNLLIIDISPDSTEFNLTNSSDLEEYGKKLNAKLQDLFEIISKEENNDSNKTR